MLAHAGRLDNMRLSKNNDGPRQALPKPGVAGVEAEVADVDESSSVRISYRVPFGRFRIPAVGVAHRPPCG